MPSRISARNQLNGRVTKVTKDGLMASIDVEIETPQKVNAVITSRSAEDLDLKARDHVSAVIKATEVMIGRD